MCACASSHLRSSSVCVWPGPAGADAPWPRLGPASWALFRPRPASLRRHQSPYTVGSEEVFISTVPKMHFGQAISETFWRIHESSSSKPATAKHEEDTARPRWPGLESPSLLPIHSHSKTLGQSCLEWQLF